MNLYLHGYKLGISCSAIPHVLPALPLQIFYKSQESRNKKIYVSTELLMGKNPQSEEVLLKYEKYGLVPEDHD